MIYLRDKLETNLYEITSTYLEKIQQIINEFDEIISKGSYDIGNYLTIKHAIRLITDVLVVEKMEYHTLKKYK